MRTTFHKPHSRRICGWDLRGGTAPHLCLFSQRGHTIPDGTTGHTRSESRGGGTPGNSATVSLLVRHHRELSEDRGWKTLRLLRRQINMWVPTNLKGPFQVKHKRRVAVRWDKARGSVMPAQKSCIVRDFLLFYGFMLWKKDMCSNPIKTAYFTLKPLILPVVQQL